MNTDKSHNNNLIPIKMYHNKVSTADFASPERNVWDLQTLQIPEKLFLLLT